MPVSTSTLSNQTLELHSTAARTIRRLSAAQTDSFGRQVQHKLKFSQTATQIILSKKSCLFGNSQKLRLYYDIFQHYENDESAKLKPLRTTITKQNTVRTMHHKLRK